MHRNHLTLLVVSLVVLVVWNIAWAFDLPDETADLRLALSLFLPVTVAVVVTVREAIRLRTAHSFVHLVRGVLAGLFAGLALGVSLRLSMRVVAIAAGEAPQFSVGGTLIVVGIGIFYGGSFGTLFAVLRRSVQIPHVGLCFGIFMALLFWRSFYQAATGDLQGVIPTVIIVLLTTLLSAMWVAYGTILEWLLRLMGERRGSVQ